jgi:pimeloyl-ACP methyl ester carboxylesterase
MIRIVCNIMLVMLFVSCQKIDSFMFENVVIQEYELEEYIGETQIIIDSSYAIDADKMHLLSFSSGGHTIYGVYIGDTQTIDKDTVIMYCHGNAGHIDWYWSRQKLLAHVGGKYRYGVLMIDYKGYGMSQGQPTQAGLVEDIQSGINWLQSKGLSQDRLVIYGFSLGSYPSTYLSASDDLNSLKPSKLILEAPFASTKVMVNDASKLSMSNKYYTTTDYAVADLIKAVDQPFLWMHGKDDAFLSIKTHGEVVFKNYLGNDNTALRVDSADHSDLPYVYGYEPYKQVLLDFITK